VDSGENYSINFPLMDGIDDQSYESIFKPVLGKIMETFRPGAVVLQCGADSLAGDRLGCFNLSLKGHGMCVEYMKSFGVPLLVLGGGGYTVRNVARCWAYETGLILDAQLSEEVPYNEYYEYYGPDFNLHITPSNMENQNNRKFLEEIKGELFETLRGLPPAPSVQIKQQPRDLVDPDKDHDDDADPDVRLSQKQKDKMVAHGNEFYDDDKDQDAQGSAKMETDD